MNPKIIKNTLLATIVIAVLCAGTVSARQMRSQTMGFACFGVCSETLPCFTGCLCKQASLTLSVCVSALDDEPAAKATKH